MRTVGNWAQLDGLDGAKINGTKVAGKLRLEMALGDCAWKRRLETTSKPRLVNGAGKLRLVHRA